MLPLVFDSVRGLPPSTSIVLCMSTQFLTIFSLHNYVQLQHHKSLLSHSNVPGSVKPVHQTLPHPPYLGRGWGPDYTLSCWSVSVLIFSFCSVDGVHRIMVATSEAILYVASIDPREGGECRYKQFKLVTACFYQYSTLYTIAGYSIVHALSCDEIRLFFFTLKLLSTQVTQ